MDGLTLSLTLMFSPVALTAHEAAHVGVARAAGARTELHFLQHGRLAIVESYGPLSQHEKFAFNAVPRVLNLAVVAGTTLALRHVEGRWSRALLKAARWVSAVDFAYNTSRVLWTPTNDEANDGWGTARGLGLQRHRVAVRAVSVLVAAGVLYTATF